MGEYVVRKSICKPLMELQWVLNKALENNTDKKSALKVENWLKSHSDISSHEVPKELMDAINLFDIRKYGKIQIRFENKQ